MNFKKTEDGRPKTEEVMPVMSVTVLSVKICQNFLEF